MLYKKNVSKTLDEKLFKNPTSEYRATPFWAWNDDLEKEELNRQIDEFKEMGLGGFHMHVRCGLNTPYLSEEFMNLIKSCTDKAKKEEMLAWLYDEDRWPSGAGGGFVTANREYAQKRIYFTTIEKPEVATYSNYVVNGYDKIYDNAISTGEKYCEAYLLGVYDVVLNDDGTIKEYSAIKPNDAVKGVKWYAYAEIMAKSGWCNGQSYIDIFNKDAVKKFIDVVYEGYYKAVGDEFDKTVPAIFTDEPHYLEIIPKKYANDLDGVQLCWTTDIPNTYFENYGENIVKRLPEIIYDLPNGKANTIRYNFFNHICERYYEAFSKQIGEWCDSHNIKFTGHVMAENDLDLQTKYVGEAMRHYTKYGIPGIDILCDVVELSIAKQCQSIVHQYGKEGMLSELYGVTGWDFDFAGHKFQGDWQACLGVTVRVPHLSWYSMRGSAKRDYPASIHYQSAWYKEYKLIENHFARVNTALTRGKPIVDVAVIHPIESMWINFGPESTSGNIKSQLNNSFQEIIRWLLGGTIDFNFISESTINDAYKGVKNGSLNYGEMKYKAVVVPEVYTLRSETVKMLNEFIDNGGKVVFIADAPKFVDGVESEEGIKLYNRANKCSANKNSLLNALSSERYIEIRNQKGSATDNYMYQRRIDGDYEWLFIAPFKKAPKIYLGAKSDCLQLINLTITLNGEYTPELYNTISGEIEKVSYEVKNGVTKIYYNVYETDSILLKLNKFEKGNETCYKIAQLDISNPDKIIDFKTPVEYTLSEPNVLVLDIAKYSIDGKNYEPLEEILKIDLKLRKQFGYPKANGQDTQPWVIGKETEFMYPYLKFTFDSDVSVPCKLAFEGAKEIIFNGEKVDINIDGYFTDRHIYTTKLPNLKVGKNELIVSTAFSKRTSLENYFILGDFGVEVKGAIAKIIKKPSKISFGSVVNQGLPFYGAGITYKVEVETENCDMYIDIGYIKGTVTSVSLDGELKGKIAFKPNALLIKDVKKGKHVIEFTLYLSRVNCFASIHNIADPLWKGANHWYSDENQWAYEYQLLDNGILRSPLIKLFNK